MSILIAVGLSLIALAAGMFLLAKTKRENLGMFYSVISFFIIAATFVVLACTALHASMIIYGKGRHYKMKMDKNFMKADWNNNYRGNYSDNSCCGKGGCGKGGCGMQGCGMSGCGMHGCGMADCSGKCGENSKCSATGKDSCK